MADIPKYGSFAGKVVLITGGSKGIGEGCARAFCSAGATVVICARGSEEGQALQEELNATMRGRCLFRKCDVTVPEQIQALIEFVVKEFGRLDCLVNNAGWHPPDVRIDEVSIDDFKSLLQLNLVSVFAACKYALPHLRKTKGSIINMASLVGTFGQANACSYVATKCAIIGLTKALAIDEALHGVRVNSVSPACILTPLSEGLIQLTDDPQTKLRQAERFHQLKRWGTIEEVGAACLFLASEGASFITGVDLPVSGGAELGYGDKFAT